MSAFEDLPLNLEFWEIPSELLVLDRYLELVEKNLPQLVKRETERVWDGLDPESDEDAQVAARLQYELETGITTRFLTGAGIIAVWAAYESGLERLSERLRTLRGINLRSRDLRGEFLERVRKYFAEVLRFELHPADTDWSRLEALAALRHGLAHANGRLDDMHSHNRKKKVEELACSNSGVTIVEGCVVLAPEFVREVWKFVDKIVNELNWRVRDEVKRSGQQPNNGLEPPPGRAAL